MKTFESPENMAGGFSSLFLSRLREDIVIPSSPRAEILAKAPAVSQGYVVAPAVWDTELSGNSLSRKAAESFNMFLNTDYLNKLFEIAIGLEVHCELSTASKLFCGCKNTFGARPNTLCCPVCAGLPGAIPQLNAVAVEYAVKMGLALNCTVNSHSCFHRKHYNYPDLPKGYQITQYDTPLCANGRINTPISAGASEIYSHSISVTRLHIEEDAGKLLHCHGKGVTLADYNRCGVPLIEIVTAPDIRSPGQAKAALEEIVRILRYLRISSAKMQEGSVRADVNISLRRWGQKSFGVRTELKNLNSFGALYRAAQWEAARQAAVLADGGTVYAATLRWDDAKRAAQPMRTKESAADYRFTPEPALSPLHLAENTDAIKALLPELPAEKRRRYTQDYLLSAPVALLLSEYRDRAEFFELAVECRKAPAVSIANWMLGEVARLLNERKASLSETELIPGSLAVLAALTDSGALSHAAAKQLFAYMAAHSVQPHEVSAAIQKLNLTQISDGASLEKLVQNTLAKNPDAAADFKAGKSAALGYLLGQCMKASGLKANPRSLKSVLEKSLAAQEFCKNEWALPGALSAKNRACNRPPAVLK